MWWNLDYGYYIDYWCDLKCELVFFRGRLEDFCLKLGSELFWIRFGFFFLLFYFDEVCGWLLINDVFFDCGDIEKIDLIYIFCYGCYVCMRFCFEVGFLFVWKVWSN